MTGVEAFTREAFLSNSITLISVYKVLASNYSRYEDN